MKKAKILKDYARMCSSKTCACTECSFASMKNKYGVECMEFMEKHPEEAVEIIEAWAKENPEHTYLTDFLEKYPNARFDKNESPSACPYNLGYIKECPEHISCEECWNTPMEEG